MHTHMGNSKQTWNIAPTQTQGANSHRETWGKPIPTQVNSIYWRGSPRNCTSRPRRRYNTAMACCEPLSESRLCFSAPSIFGNTKNAWPHARLNRGPYGCQPHGQTSWAMRPMLFEINVEVLMNFLANLWHAGIEIFIYFNESCKSAAPRWEQLLVRLNGLLRCQDV